MLLLWLEFWGSHIMEGELLSPLYLWIGFAWTAQIYVTVFLDCAITKCMHDMLCSTSKGEALKVISILNFVFDVLELILTFKMTHHLTKLIKAFQFMQLSKTTLNLPSSSLHLCSPLKEIRRVKIHHQFTSFPK